MRQMMFEGFPLGGEERRLVRRAVKKTSEIAFPIICHAVAQNQIVHPATDVDRVDLHIPMMRQDRGKCCYWCVQEHCAAMESPGFNLRKIQWSWHKTLRCFGPG